MGAGVRDLALFNLAIDSKLRGCDLVRLQVRDVAHSGRVIPRTTVMQQKTGQPVKFELTEQTREAVEAWIAKAQLSSSQFLFPSRMTRSPRISTRQYARIVKSWVARIGLAPGDYGTHSMRRTKATLIYKRSYTLTLADYTSEHREQLLFNHLYFSDLPDSRLQKLVEKRVYRQIIAHKHFNPRIVESISKHANSRAMSDEEYVAFVEREFDDPSKLWEHLSDVTSAL